MRHRIVCLILAGLLSEAQAQAPGVTADGTAFGSRVSLGGQPIAQLTTADTDEACPTTHSATAPGSFGCTAPAEGAVTVPGVATVVNSGDSSTSGVADADSPCDSMVTSTAGQDPSGDCAAAGNTKNSVAVVVPGTTALVEVVNTCSQATVSGVTGLAGKSFVQSVIINGTPVPINSSADTTIVADQLPLIRLNHPFTVVDPTTGTLSIQQDAVRIQAPDDNGAIFQVLVSSAKATLTNLPATCPAFPCPAFDLNMDSAFEKDEGCPDSPDAGDQVRFTLQVTNSGTGDGTSLLIADRIPENASLDPSSPMLDGQSVPFDTNCPGTVTFTSCPRSSPDTPQCLTVQAGDLVAGATKTLTFTVTVNSTGDVCNTAVTSITPVDPLCNLPSVSQEISRLVLVGTDCPPPTTPTPTPTVSDRLVTTGSGGCALGPAQASGEAWPVLLMGLLFLIGHGRKSRNRRGVRSL